MILRQMALAVTITSMLGCLWALSLADREYRARRSAQAKVWQLEGERDAQHAAAASLAKELAELKAIPPVVCPEPEKPKKAVRRSSWMFDEWKGVKQ